MRALTGDIKWHDLSGVLCTRGWFSFWHLVQWSVGAIEYCKLYDVCWVNCCREPRWFLEPLFPGAAIVHLSCRAVSAKGCFICCSERGCCRETRAVVQLLLFLSSRSDQSVGAVQISAASSLLCFINVKAAEENQGGDPRPLDLLDECFVKSSYQIWSCCCCFRRKMQFLLSLTPGTVWSSARE